MQVDGDHRQAAGGHQHDGGVQDVLAGRAPVDVRRRLGGYGRGEVGDQGDHRVAARPGPEGEAPQVEAPGVGGGGHGGGGRRRGLAEAGLGAGEGGLGVEHRLEERLVAGGGLDGRTGPDRGEQAEVGAVESVS